MSKKVFDKKVPKSIIEPSIIQPKRLFTFPNGDEYFGEFIVNLKGKTIKRHGYGAYTTVTCQRFIGEWFEDRLVGTVKIVFPNRQSYEGELSEVPEYMVGKFNFGDGSQLFGDFKKNMSGNNSSALEFSDPNKKFWKINYSHKDKLIELTLPSYE